MFLYIIYKQNSYTKGIMMIWERVQTCHVIGSWL